MKFWTKVIVIGVASFILLTGLAFILAHSVSEKANQLESVGQKEHRNEYALTRKHNPQVQARIDQELRDNSLMDFSSTYQLDDQEVRDNLERDGLNMKMGAKILIFLKENAST